MPAPAYATAQQMQDYSFLPTPEDEALFSDVLLRASRMIDQACQLAPGYFAVAGTGATAKTLRGSGLSMLRLPAYVPGSITAVTLDDADETAITEPYVERDGYLVFLPNSWRVTTIWSEYQAYKVTARWGFEAVPDEIVEATIELAVAIWRQKDGAFLRVVADVNSGATGISGQAMPERVKMICNNWRAKQPAVAA